ncbi:MAG: topoisomerase DNA-binding C4 zinc finger domain-containing protein [Candidatus Roizmanbacteria bacterium]|nr:MAG: topoisomerase DNA-binding C4 zinc finger domain-containing protein [Candidatus Roizmanbacteria bacterium]
MEKTKKTQTPENCPKCGSALGSVMETKSGKQFQRCSTGSWNAQTRSVDGCDFIKWITPEPKALDEKCPKCGEALMLTVTKFGKKLKKCSTSKWDPDTRTQSGCDYVEWIKGVTEQLNEECPDCGSALVMYTSAAGKKMKKCSTNQWDPKTRASSGCTYIQWQK